MQQQQFRSVVWLRAVACLLVVWSHLVASFLAERGIDWLPLRWVRTYISDPLALGADMSILGVCIFFVISGFIVTHAALNESIPAFIIKRVLRIYPPLLLSLIVIAIVVLIHEMTTGTAFRDIPTPTAENMLHSLWLVSVFWDRNWNLNPVAWSLVLEVMFYGLVALTLPTLRRRPLAVIAFQCALLGTAVLTFPQRPVALAFIALEYTLLVPLFWGQALYLAYAGRISWKWFAAIWVALYALQAWSLPVIHPDYLLAQPAGLVSKVGAFAIVAALLVFERQLSLPRVVNWCAEISYSLYLNHAVLGFALLGLLLPLVGYELALAATMVVVLGLSWASWKWIERPSQRLARRLIRLKLSLPVAAIRMPANRASAVAD